MSESAQESYRLEEVAPAESLRLLRGARVGRVVYTEAALPAVTPVNFAMDGRAVVFRTAAGSALARAVDDAVVAFQVDDIRHEPGAWWSVVILGVARVCTDVAEVLRAEHAGVVPWAEGDRSCYVRIVPSRITGRRLVPVKPAAVPA
ncbi:MAG: pyridoxamine 5'-phosphate oxidase family protein [Kineosporiaceae bacterium]